jgi:uncharacterized protein
MPISRPARRICVVATTSLAVLLGTAVPAAAHVTVGCDDAAPGGFGQLAFRVPTERDTATTKVQVEFPAGQPLAFTAVRPHPGWTYQVARRPLATPIVDDDGAQVTETVGSIEWTAAGADTGIKPGEYDEFLVDVGPLPKAGTMVFKAVQTYADGQVVRWIDAAAAGGPEPEHPAPVLAVGSEAATTAHATATGETGSSPAVWWAFALSAAALVLSAGSVALSIRRRTKTGG